MAELPSTEPLLTLLALAEAGSESAAAEVLGIGQSSISRRLATLQRASREPLTQRTAGGSKLTPAGERLLPHARAVRNSLTAAARLLAADGAGPLALRFGVAPELAPRFMGPLVLAATTAAEGAPEDPAPRLEPTFIEASNEDMLDELRAGRLQAALTSWAPAGREPGFEVARLTGDSLVLVSAAGGDLFSGGEIDAAALRRRPLLTPPETSGLTLRAKASLRRAGLEPLTTVTLGSQAAVLAAVQEGAGVGVALASSCQAEVSAGWLNSAPLPGNESQVDVWFLLADSLSARDQESVRGLVAQTLARAGSRPS